MSYIMGCHLPQQLAHSAGLEQELTRLVQQSKIQCYRDFPKCCGQILSKASEYMCCRVGSLVWVQDVQVAEPEHMLAAGLWEDIALPALKKVCSLFTVACPCMWASCELVFATHVLCQLLNPDTTLTTAIFL